MSTPQYPNDPSQYGQPVYGSSGSDPSTERVAAAEKKATQALILSIAGILCCGVLSIVGIVFGFQAKKELDAAGRSSGKALAAIIIGFALIAVNIIGGIYSLTQS